LRATASKRVSVLGQEAGLRVCGLPFRIVVGQALKEGVGDQWNGKPG
jgi:hypothetical protein